MSFLKLTSSIQKQASPALCVLVIILSMTLNDSLRAQTGEIDSLRQLVKNAETPAQVDILNALAFRWLLIDMEESNRMASQALATAEKIKYLKGIAEGNIYTGMYHSMKGNKKPALRLLIIGRESARAAGETGLESYAMTQIGNLYRNLGTYDSAKQWYDLSFEILKDSLNPRYLSILYRNLGLYYNLTFDPKNEIVYLRRSYQIRKQLPDKILLIDILVQLSKWHLDQAEPETAGDYLHQAETLIGPNETETEIYFDIKNQKAKVNFRLSNYARALSLLEEVKVFYLRHGSLNQLVKLQTDIGELLEEIGNFDLSLKNYFEALRIAEEKNFERDAVLALIGISRNYNRLNQFQLADEFGQKGLEGAEKNKFTFEQARAYNQIGLNSKARGSYSEAHLNFEKALAIRKEIKDVRGEASTLANIGETLENRGQYTEAVAYYHQSLRIKESILHQSGLAWVYYDLGSAYTNLRDFKQAKFYLDKAEAAARRIKLGPVLVNVLKKRRDLLMAEGNLEAALQYSVLYDELRDSVNSTTMTNRILGLQSAYEMEQKEKEIQLQQDEITIQKSKIQQQQIIIIAVISGLLLLSILAWTLFHYFRKVSRLNNEVHERSEEIKTQSEELAKINVALHDSNKSLSEKNEEIQTQAEELTEANQSLSQVNSELTEKQKELAAQSEELTEANSALSNLNMELAEKQKELEAQSEELRESNEIISRLNEGLEQKVQARTGQLQQAYKELDTFFYRSSHDFRRPLTTFMGLAEVAKITLTDKTALDLFSKVKETAVNLDRMLIKLQSISDVGAEQFVVKPISIQTVFEGTIHTYREMIDQTGIKVSIFVEPLPLFQTYPAFLKIIVDNLLENSIQFSKKRDAFVRLEARAKDGGVEISVLDNGIGVEDEYKDRLLDMFFRGSEQSKGNGLGLYIVKKAVEKLHGHLIIKTTYQEGTTVKIWLPLQLTTFK